MKLLTKALTFTTIALSLSGLAMADTNQAKSKMENNTTSTATTAPTQAEITASLAVIAQGLYAQLDKELGLTPDELKIVAADFAKLANGEKLDIPEQEVFTKVIKFISERHQKEALAAMSKLSEKNIKLGKEAFEKFSKEDGVKVLKSGVAVKLEGFEPQKGGKQEIKAGDTVNIFYKGTFVDGKVFDSNVESGKPTPFPLDGIIPGLRDALIGQSTGEKLRILIPADQAYGEQGVPGVIEPSSYLFFDVTIVSIAEPTEKK